MSDNTKEAPLTEQKSELIYKLEDRPPVKEALFAAFQHLLAIFVAIITYVPMAYGYFGASVRCGMRVSMLMTHQLE